MEVLKVQNDYFNKIYKEVFQLFCELLSMIEVYGFRGYDSVDDNNDVKKIHWKILVRFPQILNDMTVNLNLLKINNFEQLMLDIKKN